MTIVNYEKALKLSPDDTDLKKILQAVIIFRKIMKQQ